MPEYNYPACKEHPLFLNRYTQSTVSYDNQQYCLFLYFTVWFFTSQSTAMVMSGRSVHLTTLFSWASLTKLLTSTEYFMYILLLVTDNNQSWISRREENGCRNYFMMNLHESMGPGHDWTRHPWICSQTCIWLLPTALHGPVQYCSPWHMILGDI